MDVVAVQSSCGHCGYLRVGIPLDARCPECGGPPPIPVTPLVPAAGAAMDRSQQAWLATISVGLALLTFCSIYAIQSELFVNSGGLTLAVLNAPAPKLTAAACLLREIGNPGEWGVQGFVATLGTLLAVWLVTVPHPSMPGRGFFNARCLTRGLSVLTFGPFFGALVGGNSISPYWGWALLPSMLIAVGLVELPVNTLLYLHLAKLSRRFDASGANKPRFGLFVAAGLYAATCVSGVAISWLRGQMEDQPVVIWRVVQIAYGALAIAAGLFMSSGLLRLLARTTAATLDANLGLLPIALHRLIETLRAIVAGLRADPTRFAALAGLLVWMCQWWPTTLSASASSHSYALIRDLRGLNFLGPKFLLYGTYPDVLSSLAPVWLMTAFRPAVRRPSAGFVRWSITLGTGAVVGYLRAVSQSHDDSIHEYADVSSLVVELPATLLMYLYAGGLAADMGRSRLALDLRSLGTLAVVMMGWPVFFDWLAANVRLPGHRASAAIVIGTAYGAILIASGIIAWMLLLRLAWTLLTGRRRERMVP